MSSTSGSGSRSGGGSARPGDGAVIFVPGRGWISVPPCNPAAMKRRTPLPAGAQKLLLRLREEITEREAEMARVLGQALGLDGVVITGPVGGPVAPGGDSGRRGAVSFVFFRDGQGRAGVWDEAEGVCASDG